MQTDDDRQVGARTLSMYFLIYSESIITNILIQCQKDVLVIKSFAVESIKQDDDLPGLRGWKEPHNCSFIHLAARHYSPSLLTHLLPRA